MYLNIYKVFPNFIMITILYLSIYGGRFEACVAGFLFGMCWDAFATDMFGLRMLVLTIIGFIMPPIIRKLDGQQVSVQFFVTAISMVVYWFLLAVIYIAFNKTSTTVFESIVNLRNLFTLIETVIFAPFAFLILRVLDMARRVRR
jgi:rod shape-determining protein MreD